MMNYVVTEAQAVEVLVPILILARLLQLHPGQWNGSGK